MTSMEALAKFCFKHLQSDDDGFNLLLDKEDVELLEIIQKDLEILDILKNIEEELGIDLITLNKLRKADKIYVKFFNEIQEWNKIKVDLRYCKIWYGYNSGKGYGLCQPLSNYGTGFALTREELKK